MHKITVQCFDPADGDDFKTAYRERHVPLAVGSPRALHHQLSPR